MTRPVKRLLFWTPRILCILFAVFLSVFALDVFGEGYSIGETAVALFMHLIPTFVVLIVLAVTWRREWVGAILFVALAVFYVIMFWGPNRLSAYLIISGPLVLMGVLFLLNWLLREELRAGL